MTGQLVSTASTKQLYNPQCFLQYENATAPPPSWNVNQNFLDRLLWATSRVPSSRFIWSLKAIKQLLDQ